MSATTGHCLCGAVTVRVESLSDEISACFCHYRVRFAFLSIGVELILE